MYREKLQENNGVTHRFDYRLGTVTIQVLNWIPPFSTIGCGFNATNKEKVESERQLREYTMSILLHPYQARKIEGVHSLRALAMVIDDIAQYVLRENIPLCMPDSRGWKYPETYSRIVYHELKTKNEARIQK